MRLDRRIHGALSPVKADSVAGAGSLRFWLGCPRNPVRTIVRIRMLRFLALWRVSFHIVTAKRSHFMNYQQDTHGVDG
jgi:hypothetical protein